MKYSKIVQNGRLLAATTAAVVSLPVFAASNGLCGPDSCTLIADVGGSGVREELFYRPGEVSAGWYEGVESISRIGGPGWQPIVGDFNNDGFDDLAAYKDGVFTVDWNVNGSYNTSFSTYSLPSSARFSATTIPIVGDWDGMGGDDFGIYTDGMFRLFPDKNDFSNKISISFGSMPQNPGYIFTQMPFSGPIGGAAGGIDRVGIFYGTYAQYAPKNVDSRYRFFDLANTTAVYDYIERPGMYARPHILETGQMDPIFSFIMPPDLPAVDPSVCDEPEYSCAGIFDDRPDTEQPVIIIPGSFP